MFSFHKPKIYRSISGCCICRAKSSSSRFTDSKKYEAEFEKCFRIDEKRSGEICNACVLLVKRWKKLPTGTNKDWHHVVDARAGPGTKSFKTNNNNNNNNKSSNNSSADNNEKKRRSSSKSNRNNEKLCLVKSSPTNSSSESDTSDVDDDVDCDVDEMMMDELDDPHQIDQEHHVSGGNRQRRSLRRSTRLAGGKTSSIYDNELTYRRNDANSSKHQHVFKKHRNKLYRDQFVSFLDSNIWKREKICCGIIFKGPNNEVLIYPELFQPCSCRPASSSSSSSTNSQESQQNNIYQPFNDSMPSKKENEQKTIPLIPELIKHQKSFELTNEETSKSESDVDQMTNNTPPPSLIKPSFDNNNSNQSSSGGNNHQNEIDDQSSGVLSMGQCDENSIQDSISDRLSTISSSLLDNDDGNISSSSETYEHETDHDDLVKRNGSPKTASQANNPPPPSLAVV